jgi:glyoxylase-like metal-dependent hydrolase (beta-lactamase superfamily II)
MLYSPVSRKSSFNVTIDDLRSAAAMSKGTAPDHINVLSIAEGIFPPGFAVAGKFRSQKVPLYTYQIVFKGNRDPVIVDTGISKEHLTGVFKGIRFNRTAFDSLQNAMKRASQIVFTHEHVDHIGGFSKSPYYNEIAEKTILTSEQKESRLLKYALFESGSEGKTKSISYQKLFPFAPGIVLIKTPGHTPGHQSVYIHLSNGKEFILAGDIGWNLDAIRIHRGRPLLASLVLGEDRSAVAHELRWLSDMAKQGITLLISHDLENTKKCITKGLIQEVFE